MWIVHVRTVSNPRSIAVDLSKYAARATAKSRAAPFWLSRPSASQSPSTSATSTRVGQRLMISGGITSASRIGAVRRGDLRSPSRTRYAWSVRKHRNGQPRVAAEQHRPCYGLRSEPRAYVVERGVECAAAALCERQRE